MSYADWPLAVPYRSEREPWGLTPAREAISTDMEGGDVRQRRRPGDDLGTMTWGRGLGPAQISAFRQFLGQIAEGAARFLMPVSLDGQTYELRVVQIKGGAGGIRYSSIGAETMVQFTLYVFPASMSPA